MTVQEVLSWVRPHIHQLIPYTSARSEYKEKKGILLDANENALGAPVEIPSVNRYPDPLQESLKNKLAELKKVSPAQLFLGNGSDEAIDLLLRIFCTPGMHEVVILPPTYGMYEVLARIHDVAVKKIPLDDTYQPRVESIFSQVTSHTRMIFFCSPNNPTGNLIHPYLIEQVLQRFSGIVVVDEAYIDYARAPSWIHQISTYAHLIVLQTLSKAWGLAGARLGMAFARPEIITLLNKVKMPYNISLLTQKVVLQALEHPEFLYHTVQKTLVEKEKLAENLIKLPIVRKVYPSDANFLLVKMDQAHAMYHKLLEKKIVVRNRSQVEKCEDCLRITVGTPAENAALLEAIQEIIKEKCR
ncbi:MAG: histidinol-phosphate transaminase [Bacteroidia bacterium]